MRCPKCSHMDDKVIDSRTVRNGDVIRRRRVCLDCGHRFTTYEEVGKIQFACDQAGWSSRGAGS